MKIISLNVWGGRVSGPLMEFLQNYRETDVICLQEVYRNAPRPVVEDKGDRLNLLSEIEGLLTEHASYFEPDLDDFFGIAIFVKKSLTIRGTQVLPIYDSSGEKGNHPRNLQSVDIESNGKMHTIANLHGLWNGGGKTDTEDRLEQSRRICSYISTRKNDIVICGDFNLEPQTESVQLIEAAGMRNLVKEYGITSTRTSLYTKPVRFADYAFVSDGVEVKQFTVLPDEVSDHSPLFLEIG